MVSVRLDWTLAEFYADGGVDKFVDRMAAVLGINASQIKTVAVYTGSVIVEIMVSPAEDDTNPEETKEKMNLKFMNAVSGGTLVFGAPIIDASSDNRIVATGYVGEHEAGKEGNLWDHLIREDTTTTPDNSNTTPVNGNTNTEATGTGNTNTIVDAEASKPIATDSTKVTAQVLVASEEAT